MNVSPSALWNGQQGTTWYTNRMWPASYWGQWSDHIIHRIHLRVLMHIQAQAEMK